MATVTLRPTSDYAQYPTNRSILYEVPKGDTIFYDKVNETTPDEGATRNECLQSNKADAYVDYGFTSTGITAGTITDVTITARYAQSSDKMWLQPRIEQSYYGTRYTKSDTSYTNQTWSFSTNPDTGSAWTWTDINNLVAGIGFGRDTTKGSPAITQFYLVVTYTPPPSVPTLDINGMTETKTNGMTPVKFNGVS